MGSVIWAVKTTAAYTQSIQTYINMIFVKTTAILIASTAMVFGAPSPAPAPGSILDGLFKDAPLAGPLGGLAAGGLLASALGFKTKDSILSTINTIANVADAKIGLHNLNISIANPPTDTHDMVNIVLQYIILVVIKV